MLKVYTLDDRETWDHTVRSFAQHDAYYLSGYLNGFRIHGDGEPLLFYYEDDAIRGISALLRRDVSSLPRFSGTDGYYDLISVYGYGGWIVEPKDGTECDISGLEREYAAWCRENGIVSEFVRFHPLLDNWRSVDGMYDVIHLGHTVYMNTESEDIIWQNITSKNRNVIRKAVNSGLKTYWCRDPRIIDTFMQIYKETMDKDNAGEYYYFKRDYYLSVLEDLRDEAMWFYTMVDGEVAAISIFLFENGNMHYHLSASRREYQRLAPTNLLLYDAALWACRHGYKRLHMGGGVGSAEDSLYKFKKAFNRSDDREFCIGKKIFDKEAYDRLVELRAEADPAFDRGSSFFPLYRA